MPKTTHNSRAATRLRDIAERAGVSVNTVSRALTGKPDVNPQTRARITALAESLGYTPNLLARSLLRGRSHSVGLVVTDCTNPFYAALIGVAEDVLSRNGFGLLLATSNEDKLKEKQALAMLRERRIDGLLLTPVDIAAPHLREVLRSELPVVLLGRRPRGYGGPFVGTNNEAGARLVVDHLVALGHRRIAHVTRDDRASSALERLDGYRKALAKAGVAADDALIARCPPTIAGGRMAASWALDLAPRPTAVFTYNDLQAVGLMLELQEAGLPAPAEVSIAGFDNIELSDLVRPRLTTVGQPTDEIGMRGARILIDLIQGRAAPRPILLPPTLIERESTSRADGVARTHQRISSSGRNRVIAGT